ncbi:MAG: hypothetical protein MUP97_05755 [Acidimicrobiia bacterium]|nr:hypothetical protein [Acidimicrobiia bacterium]
MRGQAMGARVPGIRLGIATLAAAALIVLSTGIGVAEPDDPSADSTTTTAPSSQPASEPAASAAGVQAQAGSVAYTIINNSETCRLATVGLADGVVTALPAAASSLACVADLTFGPDSGLYGIIGDGNNDNGALNVHLVQFDLTTGAPTDLGTITGNFTYSTIFGTSDAGIATGGDGRVYATIATNEILGCGPAFCIYDVNVATRVATLVGPVGTATGPFADKPLLTMTADCGTTMWTLVSRNETTQQLFLVTVSQSTGAATQGPLIGSDPPPGPFGIEFDRTSRNLYFLAGVGETPEALYTLDPSSGTPTKVTELSGDAQGSVERLAIQGTCPAAPAPVEVVIRFTG